MKCRGFFLSDVKPCNTLVGISLDNFGPDYFSISHLRAFPFDKIKIDIRFVQEMCSSTGSAAIVRAVIGLGASLSIETTAEGAKT
jgi:predicted signal transduction protein with EAL and GGDEF domain